MKTARQLRFEDYDGFVEKFKPKPKLTTDDCYTPPAVYQVVLDFVRTLPDTEGGARLYARSTRAATMRTTTIRKGASWWTIRHSASTAASCGST